MLALTYPEADMLLEVVLVKMAIGLVTDVTPRIVLALTYPEAVMLLEEMVVVTRSVKLKLPALTYPEADMLLAVMLVKVAFTVPIAIIPVFAIISFAIFLFVICYTHRHF